MNNLTNTVAGQMQEISYAMTCKTSELKDSMKFLSRAVPRNKKGRLYNCEITIKTNEVSFVVIGAAKTIYCNAIGPVKVSIPFWYLNDIVSFLSSFSITLTVTEGQFTIGNLSVKAETCFFRDDKILRSIKLPMNYSIAQLLEIRDQYTPEEIKFNRIDVMINKITAAIAQDIDKIAVILKKYGVTPKEIEKFIYDKINYQPKN